MPSKPFHVCATAVLLGLATTATAAEPIGVNYVAATDRIHTAGQPTAETLAGLAAQGFELVVNLAPPIRTVTKPPWSSVMSVAWPSALTFEG